VEQRFSVTGECGCGGSANVDEGFGVVCHDEYVAQLSAL
jgi:hypothetical protein